MSEMKPCPFCGGTKICTEKGINLNYCDNCSAESNIEHWNTRPIEDDLRNRIAELEEEQVILKDQLREATNFLIDKKLHVDSLYEDGFKLQKRIAELVQTLSHIVYRGGQIIVNLNERVREDEWNRLTRGIVVDEEREE